tara:strand:- start:535 stop:1791 length:1257 start_codon:yes stop_codon:yes gene_type:complete
MNKQPLLWIIQHLSKKSNIYLPDTINDYFIESNCGIHISDISFYFHYIISDAFKNKQEDMKTLYTKAKKIKNSFKRLIYLRKVKKANHVTTEDLYLNPLTDFPDNQKVSLFIDNTIYDFRIANIINLWNDCLTKNEGLFVKPSELKNPFTNIPFKKYNLYNLFFSILDSKFIMNSMILSFFKIDFCIDTFIYINFPLLKDICISNFIKSGSIHELYDEINNMLVEYEKDINYFYLPTSITHRRKKFYIRELSSILHYHCISKFSCNPLKKKCSYERCKKLLKEYFDNSSNSAFYIRGVNLNTFVDSHTQIPVPNIMITNTDLEAPPLPNQQSIVPPVSSPTTINNFEMEIIESQQDDLEVQSISSESDDDLSDINYSPEINNPFESTYSLPRTPPNRNTSQSPTPIQSPFRISLFRRH